MSFIEFEEAKKTEWTLTDDDCCQLRRTDALAVSNVYELTQINLYPGHFRQPPHQDEEYYKVAHGHIDMRDYTEEEIADILSAYGYDGLDDFVEQTSPDWDVVHKEDGSIDRENSPSYIVDFGLIAEMFFEAESVEYETDIEYNSWNEAVEAVEAITGYDLGRVKDERVDGAADRGRESEAVVSATAFVEKLRSLGIDPLVLPEVLRAANDLAPDVRALVFDKDFVVSLHEKTPETGRGEMTLGEYLEKYQQDIDVIVWDADTGEHGIPAICYISPDELSSGEYDYEDWEKWILSLPLDHINTDPRYGCQTAVVTTDYTLDQVGFLLGSADFETKKWHNLYDRAVWAGTDFSARLAFLENGTPFEVSFDGNCMDAADPEQQLALCELLVDNNNVFIATYPYHEDQFYAYEVHLDEKGRVRSGGGEVDIKHTEPGKGLTSTLQGKAYWAEHCANKARAEARGETMSHTGSEKSSEKGR